MRPAVLLAALAMMTRPATAEDDLPAVRWVGAWSGKLTLKGCADDGKKKVTLDVALTSTNELRSNGDLLVEGFGDLDWVPDDKKLVIRREGLEATFTPGKKGAAFALKTTGGCSIKGTLVRPSSGMPDCDRVRALATIKSQCQQLASDTRGQSLADVDAEWKAWTRLKGKKKKAQSLACKDQAATLLGEVGACSGAVTSGVPECDAYMRAVQRFEQCTSVPQDQRDAQSKAMVMLLDAVRMYGTDPYYLQVYADACGQASYLLTETARSYGCSI